jgi:hypothetical protein
VLYNIASDHTGFRRGLERGADQVYIKDCSESSARRYRFLCAVVKLLHELDAAVFFHAVGQSEVGKIRVAGGLLESRANLPT